MGCTPSKNPVSDSTGKRFEVADDCYKVRKTSDDSVVSANGLRNGKASPHHDEYNSQVVAPKEEANAKSAKPRAVVFTRNEKKFTQSQLDFFKMLDKKIDAGPDYASTAEEGR